MNIYGYVRVAGEEAPIKFLEQHLDIKGAITKHLVKVQKEYSITGAAAPWVWETAPTEFSYQDIDNELQQLIASFRKKVLKIRKLIQQPIYIEMQLVIKYENVDSPIGLSLSKKTIKILSEIDAALDVDSISYVD